MPEKFKCENCSISVCFYDIDSNNICISCAKRNYSRTRKGYINKIYGAMRSTSKRRGHFEPKFTSAELRGWLESQKLFHELWAAWINSGYCKHTIPSVDRKDNSIGYEFSNMQLMTWEKNKAKENKAIIQYSLEHVEIARFSSIMEAQINIGKPKKRGIYTSLAGAAKTAYGFIWEYA